MEKVSVFIVNSFCSISSYVANYSLANVNINIGKYSELLGKRGLSGKFKIKDLYNSNDIKQWKLFYSDNSYLILNPESNEVLEYGTDSGDPYFEYSDSKYYYGGPLQYYVKNKKNKFYNITRDKEVSKVINLKNLKMNDSNLGSSELDNLDTIEITPMTISYSVSVNQPNLIKSMAFGNNINGTCTAVATGIVLQYLNKTKTPWYLPDNSYIAESLYGNKAINGTTGANIYPKAEKLHNLLTNTGLNQSIIGQWGWMVTNAMSLYKTRYLESVYLYVDYFIVTKTPTIIINQINNDIPGMMTIAWGDPTNVYDTHSMAVYGYRDSDGIIEYRCHTGWYSNVINTSIGYQMKDVWINSNYAYCLYDFQL